MNTHTHPCTNTPTQPYTYTVDAHILNPLPLCTLYTVQCTLYSMHEYCEARAGGAEIIWDLETGAEIIFLINI